MRPFSWYVRPLDSHLHPTEHSNTEDLRPKNGRTSTNNSRQQCRRLLRDSVSVCTVNSLSYYLTPLIPRHNDHWAELYVRISRVVDPYPIL